GGARLYLFVDERAPAELVRGKLTEWAIALGYAGVEVLPKQSKLAREGDPVTGEAMTAEGFLAAADRLAVSSSQALEDISPAEDDVEELLRGGPPCLQALARSGFGDWQNNGLFNLGVYLRKRHGDAD